MLHVWIRAQTSPLAVWHIDDQQWHTVASWQQLQESYQDYQSGHKKTLCLYFPSHHALQVATSLDSAKLKQLGVTGKQYLFEEMSLTPAEQLTVRQVGHGNHHQLYALATSDIEAWAQSASLAGFDISALLPDFLLLPAPAEGAGQQVSLYQDDYTTLLRQSDDYGMAVSYLPLITERLPQLSEICLLPAVTDSDSNSNLSTSGVNHDAIYAIAKDHALVVSKPDILPTPIKMPDRHALNFFTKVSDTKLSPYLRAALMVAMSALVLQMATDALQVYRYDQASAMTQVATAAQYEAWFPDERLNPRVKLQAQLQPKLRGDAQTASDHMAALSRISPLIKQSALKARALNMQPSMLSFTLIASDRGSLDQFVNTLNQQGLSARLERVGNQNQGEDNREISGEVIVDIISQGST